jgi:hypothetical protein
LLYLGCGLAWDQTVFFGNSLYQSRRQTPGLFTPRQFVYWLSFPFDLCHKIFKEFVYQREGEVSINGPMYCRQAWMTDSEQLRISYMMPKLMMLT